MKSILFLEVALRCTCAFSLWLVVSVSHAVAPEPDQISVEEKDPYESFNRSMHSFNDQADKYVLRPVAKAYDFVMPEFADQGVTNFFDNLDDVGTFVNSLLQAKFHNAMVSLSRVIWNTTFGLGGLIDVATSMDLINDEEDLGQTLAVWGYENSNYLVLPLWGPSTVRDTIGRVGDTYTDPLRYWKELSERQRYLLTALKIVDKRSDLLAVEGLLASSSDQYLFVRNAFLQNREYLVLDGEVEDEFSNEDLDFEDF